MAFHYHRLRVLAPYSLPPDQGAIIACNHTSYVDPLFLQAACPRLIAWMIAQEYYHGRGINFVCRQIGAIPVQRSGRDMAATRAALRALRDGRVLGLFPEGRIETQRQLLPLQSGLALLALKSGVPVVPAWLEGTQRGAESLAGAYLWPRDVQLTFGPPLVFRGSDEHPARELTDDVMTAVTKALESLKNS